MSIDPALLEAERVERAERYVCLPYPLTQVLMVDSMDSLMLAKQMVDEEKRQGKTHTWHWPDLHRQGGTKHAHMMAPSQFIISSPLCLVSSSRSFHWPEQWRGGV